MASLISALILSPSLALPQVNTEALRPNPLKPGWSGDVETNVALSRGNIELLDLGGSGRLLYQTLYPSNSDTPFFYHRVFLAVQGRLAERTQTNYINQGFFHLRWTWMLHEFIGPEIFNQYQFDQFLRLRTRALTGVGAHIEIFHTKPLMMWGGSGYMLEYSSINVDPGASDSPESLEHRWANYMTVRASLLDDNLYIQGTIYLQPRFDQLSDLRLLDELEISSKITARLSMGTSFSLFHDSRPPTDVKRTDLRLVSKLGLTF